MTSEDATTAGYSGSAMPMDGVRIVDLSQVASGPYGTSMLGDFGADVIKVEPLEGDSFRDIDDGYGPKQSAYFFGVNRSKRSIALDLKSDAGYDVLTRLVAEADVFVVAFRPDVLERMRIDYETLRALNPKLIYVAITAFGETGPRAHQPGMDILAQAMSGMMGITGEVGGGPVKVGAPIADFISSYLLGFGVSAALRLRETTGHGDRISINLLDGLLSAFANFITPYDRFRKPIERQGGGHPQLVPYRPYQDDEDHYFILACMNDRFWKRLLPILDEFGDFNDPRYATNSLRVDHRDELDTRLQEIFVKKPASYWLDRFEAAGVPCGPIHNLGEALEEPQVIANESVTHLEHPVHGKYLVPNNPIRFRESPTGPRGYAPSLGQHTTEILTQAGYGTEQIAAMFDSGVVAEHPTIEPKVDAPDGEDHEAGLWSDTVVFLDDSTTS